MAEQTGAERDEYYMRKALREAEKAAAKGDVPVGAIVVRRGEIIARAHNSRVSAADPTAHAEVLALRKAGKKLGGWHLTDCTLYVTLEPCPMCAGAAINGRVDRVVYGATDARAGALGGYTDLNTIGLNHAVEVEGGVLADECAGALKAFFKERRALR